MTPLTFVTTMWKNVPGELIPVARSIVAWSFFKIVGSDLEVAMHLAMPVGGSRARVEQVLYQDDADPLVLNLCINASVPNDDFRLPSLEEAKSIAADPAFRSFLKNRVKPYMKKANRERDLKDTPPAIVDLLFHLAERLRVLENRMIFGAPGPALETRAEIELELFRSLDASPLKE